MRKKILYVDTDREFMDSFTDFVAENYLDMYCFRAFESFDSYAGSLGENGGKVQDEFDMLLVDSSFERKIPEKYRGRALFLTGDRNEAGKNCHVFRYQRPSDILMAVDDAYSRLYMDEMVKKLKNTTMDSVDLANVSDSQLRANIDIIVENHLKDDAVLDESSAAQIASMVFSSIRGLGVLDSILRDEEVTEIMINDYNVIFVEKNGRIERYADAVFESRDQLMDIIQKIVGKAGREVNQANPIVDARLEDGSRVNVVLPPIALNGPTVTIRRFSKEPMTMDRLIAYGSITPEVARALQLLVSARYNIFISGGTGSGKTTFLNALSNFIPKDERICTIEDSAELQIVGVDNLFRMETRNANSSGSGKITIKDLIKTSLRQRPDRIIVGEVRGAEALDMLQAMNTGHDGSLSTGHANSSRDMLARLETMVLQGAEGFPLEAIKQQIGSAIDIIVHLSRLRDHSRKTMEISEVVGYRNGEIVLNPLFVFREDGNSSYSHVSGRLVRTGNKMVNTDKLEAAGIREII